MSFESSAIDWLRQRIDALEAERTEMADTLRGLYAEAGALRSELNALRARYENHAQKGDLNIQMHCDTALALRQVSGALEDLVRRGTR